MQVPTYEEYSKSEIVEPEEYGRHIIGRNDAGEPEWADYLKKPATWKRTTWTVPGPPTEVEGYQEVA